MAVAAPQQIAPDVYLVTLGKGAASSNVYLMRSGSTWTLIDAGWTSSAKAIRTAAEAVFGPRRPAGGDPAHPHPPRPLRLGRHAGPVLAGAGVRACRRAAHGGRQVPAAVRHAAGPLAGRPTYAPAASPDTCADRSRGRHHRRGGSTGPAGGRAGAGGLGVDSHPWAHSGPCRLLHASDGILLAGDAALTVDLNSVGGVLLGRQQVADPPRYTTWDCRRPSGQSARLPSWSHKCCCRATDDR